MALCGSRGRAKCTPYGRPNTGPRAVTPIYPPLGMALLLLLVLYANEYSLSPFHVEKFKRFLKAREKVELLILSPNIANLGYICKGILNSRNIQTKITMTHQLSQSTKSLVPSSTELYQSLGLASNGKDDVMN